MRSKVGWIPKILPIRAFFIPSSSCLVILFGIVILTIYWENLGSNTISIASSIKEFSYSNILHHSLGGFNSALNVALFIAFPWSFDCILLGNTMHFFCNSINFTLNLIYHIFPFVFWPSWEGWIILLKGLFICSINLYTSFGVSHWNIWRSCVNPKYSLGINYYNILNTFGTHIFN